MKIGKSIRGALSYNEQKVQLGTAELIFASNFSRDIWEMGFSEKVSRFEKLTQLNEKSKVNTLHLSLNFSPEDVLDTEMMQKIAADYMTRIGFGNQPFLVYQHNDTKHPHVHIVTTTIRKDGKGIFLHNIGKRKSEPARKAIEQEYGLIVAESRKKSIGLPLQPGEPQTAYYGISETKRIVSNIVREVVCSYKFSSIEELNMVLRQYNVVADQGKPNSRMFQNKGLVYCLLDKYGRKVGVPIKASSIFTSPTLSSLEKKFEKNKVKKIPGKEFTSRTVNYILSKSRNPNDFSKLLGQKNIACYVKRTDEGTVEAISFVDNRNKSVYSNDELGLSIDRILAILNNPRALDDVGKNLPGANITSNDSETLKTTFSIDLIKDLLTADKTYDDISPEFLKRKRKRRKH